MNFNGTLSASKSILNRCLIVQSYEPQLQLIGDSACEDVARMRSGLHELFHSTQIECGHGGTTLRFLALRASRQTGSFRLRGSSRLFRRPQAPIIEICRQLGVTAEIQDEEMILESQGWRPPQHSLRIDRSLSSQFASAVLLNAWGLSFPLTIDFVGDEVSNGYWKMTLNLTRNLGMNWEVHDRSLVIPPHQRVHRNSYKVEPDLSSAFALAAIALVSGRMRLQGFPPRSEQPDQAFIAILKSMGAKLKVIHELLEVEKTESLQPVDVDLKDSPDLFPVLAALCALVPGVSNLWGAPQLAHKESHRLEKVAQLIQQTGRQVERRNDGLTIFGRKPNPSNTPPFRLDTDHDHRLAFAAQVFRSVGYDIHIEHPEVVQKSFPEFWSIVNATDKGVLLT